MQANLVTICFLAMSLFLCPRDNPGLEEFPVTTGTDEQRHQGPLGEVYPSDRESKHLEVTLPVSDQTANTEGKNISPMPNTASEDKTQLFHEDANDTDYKEHVDTNLNPSKTPDSDRLEEAGLTPESWNQQGAQTLPEEESEPTTCDNLESPCSNHPSWKSKQEQPENWHLDYTWYIWKTLSIISTIRLMQKCLRRVISKSDQDSQRRPLPLTLTAAEAPLPNSETLQLLHSTCIQPQVKRKIWEGAFLEGFANDLVKAMRQLNEARGIALIDGFRMASACEIVIPFRPSDFHSFQCELQSSPAANSHICAQIKVMEAPQVLFRCPCESSDDTVCLLHCKAAESRPTANVWDDLCTKNSAFLSKYKVTRLFQRSIKEAWESISHKYEFELSICHLDAPGAHMVQFRSGRKLSFTVTPVVQYNAECHFFVGPFVQSQQDRIWSLSLTSYEDQFLKEISKGLPEQSCHNQTLQIGLFLHRKQCMLSGAGALKDSHFKAALMHLLLAKDPSEWRSHFVAQRLRDLLEFIEMCLKKQTLQHALVANPAAQKVVRLPPELAQVSSVNLFHPLVVHECIYRKAHHHFQELLKNASMLINDYATQFGSCALVQNQEATINVKIGGKKMQPV